MTSSISATNPYADLGLSPPPAEPAKTNNDLGQDDFLQLMTTQLMNQDPFAPMESGDFLAQMAQFSTVSGIQDLQNSVESLLSTLRSDRVLQASSIVGKQVLVDGDSAQLVASQGVDGKPGPGSLTGAVQVPAGVGNISLSILDAQGQVLHTQNLSASAEGLVDFNWDGQLADGSYAPSGSYRVVAQALVDGEPQALLVQTAARVDSVSLADEAIMLHTAQGSIALDDVSRILA